MLTTVLLVVLIAPALSQVQIVNDTTMVDSEWTWFYGQPSPKVDQSTATGSVVGSLIGVIAITAGVILLMRFKEKQTREEYKEKIIKRVKSKKRNTSTPIPDHFIFKKDDDLGNNLSAITNLPDEIMKEFNQIEQYDEKFIEIKETVNTATTQLNLNRNRYRDVLPYDSKLTLLKKETGRPPSKYINASLIKFSTLDQNFLVVQAPKSNMFSSFWQLAMEQNVSIIVMITALVEDGRRKAHQYWPDANISLMTLDNSMDVELLSEDNSISSFHHRQFKVTSSKKQSKSIIHIQCESWDDSSVPEDTKTMWELAKIVQDLVTENPGTLLVHCSGGVGRTGAFIGYYKMMKDYDNELVDRIDPFETVLEMRRARTKMVQKPQQYHYMIKSLSDYVNGLNVILSSADQASNDNFFSAGSSYSLAPIDGGSAIGPTGTVSIHSPLQTSSNITNSTIKDVKGDVIVGNVDMGPKYIKEGDVTNVTNVANKVTNVAANVTNINYYIDSEKLNQKTLESFLAGSSNTVMASTFQALEEETKIEELPSINVEEFPSINVEEHITSGGDIGNTNTQGKAFVNSPKQAAQVADAKEAKIDGISSQQK